jgi:hypothetical protein
MSFGGDDLNEDAAFSDAFPAIGLYNLVDG